MLEVPPEVVQSGSVRLSGTLPQRLRLCGVAGEVWSSGSPLLRVARLVARRNAGREAEGFSSGGSS